MITLYLNDRVMDAEIHAPSDNYVEIQRMNMNRESRSALFQHPDSEVVFQNITIGKEAHMLFETGIAESVWERFAGTAVFKVYAGHEGKRELLFEHTLSPLKNKEQRCWHDHRLDLAGYSGKTIDIILEVKAKESNAYAWSAWADPRIEHQVEEKRIKARKDEHSHLFVITADAMSKRFFGCYGSKEVKTPNIDKMANESVVFHEAWSSSTTTPGSYATLWSGLHPKNHRLISEWGPFPAGVTGLPLLFNGKGYHTAMFTGEAELSHARFGFSSLFNETFGANANPAQDGAITVRKFDHWLQNRPDKPLLCWLQFFDTHPPNLPPAEFADLYYSGNPEETVREAETVKKVFGIESLVEFERAMPWVQKGQISGQFRHRIMETVRAFKGLQATGPDLHEHLKHLGPKVMLGMSDYQFGNWLENQLNITEKNKAAPAEFIDWLHLVQSELSFIQDGIINWLKNVNDFNYPVSAYKSCMSYFDHLFGNFIEVLKREGIYENSTIVLVSPHGEILKYNDAVFHHHMPHPNVLQIPLIVKMPNSKPVARIKGIMNLQDLFPTLTEMFFGECPVHTDGQSRYSNMTSREDTGEQYNIAFDIANTLLSVANPPYFYIHAADDYIITPSMHGKKGDEMLFIMTDDEDGIQPLQGQDEIKAGLNKKLKEFLSS